MLRWLYADVALLCAVPWQLRATSNGTANQRNPMSSQTILALSIILHAGYATDPHSLHEK